ncbi:DUF1491 family protein [Roseitalea porphyridii]|uniref:DUF1491 family protein n=1 Tax=Roseitalea porphyridii TaxID=1852022 RepID=A0A4P6V0D7_9HYPH|nr:DUF1491 family protein [Roseitalea porphyridii]QBK30079.1 DUF1491 family protein [Roseitalea porphyridii]
MAPRVTSELFVAVLVRNARAGGGFAYVARRGNAQAGAILVAFYAGGGSGYDLYQAAPPALSDEDTGRDTRRFHHARTLSDDAELRAMIDSEARFDPDFWLIEIENWNADVGELLPLVEGD